MPLQGTWVNTHGDIRWPEVVEAIRVFFEPISAKYDERKYDPVTLEQLKTRFAKPRNVRAADLENAVRWKYGKLRQRALPQAHQQMIAAVQEAWPSFVATNPGTAEEAFEFWDNALSATSFITKSFMAHLSFPALLPIIDQHNWRAVRYFAGRYGDQAPLSKVPRSLDHIMVVGWFMAGVRVQWEADHPPAPTMQALDRYLMMFGKHVAPR